MREGEVIKYSVIEGGNGDVAINTRLRLSTRVNVGAW